MSLWASSAHKFILEKRKDNMPYGTIRRLVRDNGFGFIKSRDGQYLFFHGSEVQVSDFDSLKEGQSVKFEKGDSLSLPKAVSIKLTKKT